MNNKRSDSLSAARRVGGVSRSSIRCAGADLF